MKRLLPLLLSAAWLCGFNAAAELLWINFSFKAIVNPATGLVPSCFSSNRLDLAFDQANLWLANNGRGYRLRRVDPYLFIGSADTNGPSKWYNIDLKPDGPDRTAFDLAATTDSRYRWNSAAVNFYINNGDFSSADGTLIITAYEILRDEWHTNLFPFSVAGNWLHELGHHFGLSHVFGGCQANDPGHCTLLHGYYVGTCGLPDILPEQAYFNRDLITLANYLKYYTNCSPAEQVLANNTWYNLMSYHQITNTAVLATNEYTALMNVITESQSDIWCDNANGSRHPSVSGLTRYVSLAGQDGSNPGTASAAPLRTITNAVAHSTAADTVLIRPGNYAGPLRLTTPATLRATRAGPARLGAN
jgi:hypothetical protein